MDSKLTIGLSVVLCFVAFGRVFQLYIWPRLLDLPRDAALSLLVAPHMFRFVGLSFLASGRGRHPFASRLVRGDL